MSLLSSHPPPSPESAWFSYLSKVQLKHNQMERSSKLSHLVAEGLPLFLRRFLWLQWAFFLSSSLHSDRLPPPPSLPLPPSPTPSPSSPSATPSASASASSFHPIALKIRKSSLFSAFPSSPSLPAPLSPLISEAPPPSPVSPTSHLPEALPHSPSSPGSPSSPTDSSFSFHHGFPGHSPFSVFFPYDPSEPSPAELSNPVFKAIMADLERTFPEHELFKDLSCPLMIKMKNILVGFARRNKNVGYCQGLNFIVAMFLLAGLQEHEAFNLLVLHVEFLMPPDYYSQQLFGLHVDQEVMQELLQQHHPKFAAHCHKHQTPFTMATMNWFLTGFSHVLPLDVCFRIWDLYFFYGNQVFFWVSLAMFRMMEDQLLKLNNSGQIYMLFVQFTQTIVNPDQLIKLAMKYQRSVNPSVLEKKRKGYFPKVQSQMEDHLHRVEKYQRH